MSKWSQQEAHDSVSHRAVDRDGARIEQIGLAPRMFSLAIPLINDLRAGPSERWDARSLFPDVFDPLLEALRDKSTGVLVHPTEGELNVKVASFSYDFLPTTRNGVMLEASFTETITEDTIFDPSPASFSIAIEAVDTLVALVPDEIDFDFITFKELLGRIQAIFDSVGLIEAQIGGVVSGMIADLKALAASVSRQCNLSDATPETVSAQGVILDLIAQIRSTCEEAARALSISKQLKTYRSPFEMTWSQLARQLDCDVSDLMDLNPSLVSGPSVPAGEDIVYLAQ